jgi:hypothetical protein
MPESTNQDRRRFLRGATMMVIAAKFGIGGRAKAPSAGIARLPRGGNLPSFDGAVGWLNSHPLTASGLRGKVALIDFCTYSCINWQRQLPFLRAWAAKYKAQGLVVVGVHTPEFSFERDIENVRRALTEMRVDFPIAIDSDYAIWRAFENEYWPALYFADAEGRIRHHVFGEGQYEQSERVVQQLLAEASSRGISHDLVSVDPSGAEVQADWSNLGSDENYVGHQRTINFASPGGPMLGKPHLYSVPAVLKLNHWALAGDWTMQQEAVVLNQAGGRIAYRFHARDLHCVMGPGTSGDPVRFRVFVDGQPAGVVHGSDVDNQGNGTIAQPRMYQLIRQQAPIVDRQFEIQFLGAGAEAFSFTFG